jgi:uncharacterized protein (DUF433 family)
MKFRNEAVWPNHHPHHHAIHRGPIGRWDNAYTAKRSRLTWQDSSNSCYSQYAANIFSEASRQCPTISMDDGIMEGQPCLAGTRIPVRSVLRSLELYGSIDGVIKCYPHLNSEQVKDALYFSQLILEQPSGIDELAITA